jgi:Plants and Prokaryotes Conserved (PCC) domain
VIDGFSRRITGRARDALAEKVNPLARISSRTRSANMLLPRSSRRSGHLPVQPWDISTGRPRNTAATRSTNRSRSLTGDIALGPDGNPALHIHCVLGRRDGGALAGHLIEGKVRPTLEIILTESPAHLRKRHDPEGGLALIDPGA